jgi:hypothetical protein
MKKIEDSHLWETMAIASIRHQESLNSSREVGASFVLDLVVYPGDEAASVYGVLPRQSQLLHLAIVVLSRPPIGSHSDAESRRACILGEEDWDRPSPANEVSLSFGAAIEGLLTRIS